MNRWLVLGVLAGLFSVAAAEPPAADSRPAIPVPRDTSARNDRSSSAAPRTSDKLDLDTTTITGNRELPKVMYVVPWKRADLGDLSGRPANSLLDEVLAPVDRDVFRRQLSYFSQIGQYVTTQGSDTGNTANAH
jgi:hypothetical protein